MDRTCAVDRRHGMYGGIYLINEKHKKIGRRALHTKRPPFCFLYVKFYSFFLIHIDSGISLY